MVLPRCIADPRHILVAVSVWLLASPAGAQDIVINELHYDPPDRTSAEEFVELHNQGGAAADLTGWFFSSGIDFSFPDGFQVAPGGYVVIAEDPDAFMDRFGRPPELGPYEGRLSSQGERVVLREASGELVDEVDFAVRFPWPLASAGRGSSMELIHPMLDNNLGGSWRASGYSSAPPVPPTYLVPTQSPDWRYRKGTSEASDPISAWRFAAFTEDGSWQAGQASIGYGDGDDNTVLADMQGNYSSVYLRHRFFVEDPFAIPAPLKLRVYADDGCAVWLNGVEVARLYVPGGDLAHDDFATNHEAAWEEVDLPDPPSLLVAGENVLAVHGLNQSLTSSDFSMDAALFIPGSGGETFGDPSPGLENSVFSLNAPPQIRQVRHIPERPRSTGPFVVTAKATDPDGVADMRVSFQVVLAGDYIPAYLPLPHNVLLADPNRSRDRNPPFDDPANWVELPMFDDGGGLDAAAGDDVFTATLPPQENRALVRYRITATDGLGASVTVPYTDDRSLNFACFVYDGVPPYEVETRTVQPGGVPYTYSRDVLESLPVYHLITRASDLTHCIAYDPALRIPKSNEAARDKFNWEGAFVYEGVVYDHVRYRLRQANDRYGGSGKRSMRFRFNKGRRLKARDRHGNEYPDPWRTLNTGKLFDNKRVGNFGLTETLNNILWNMAGVPAPHMHSFHFRVVDAPEEAPAGPDGQYFGDFWGMFLATEDYDTRFLEAHDLEDGSLYKLKDGIFDGNRVKRHQGRYAVTSDADFQNIRNNLRPERPADWLNTYVHYDRWYPYHTVVEAVRHYDFRPADSHLKNRAWYFEPFDQSPYGRLWTLPHDSDASWGPNWNSGVDYSKNAIFANGGKPAFKQRYRNVIREFRDLLWTQEVLPVMIDDLAAAVAEFSRADRDRWRDAPPEAGRQDFGPIETKVQDMKNFAFVGWSGSTGPTVPAGGRALHLDQLAAAEGDATQIPHTPVVTATAPEDLPVDQLTFRTTPYRDPQGDHTVVAVEWRVGEVTDPRAPGYDPDAPRRYEWDVVARSGELRVADFDGEFAIPPVLKVGHSYRLRVRVKDSTERWSHWSGHVEFTTGSPTGPLPPQEFLRVTEVMYHALGGSDFEFIEFLNVGPATLDLTAVSLTSGLQFSFAGSEVESLRPGEYVVVVQNRRAFESRYDTSQIQIAGEYSGRLSNGGEELALTFGGGLTILRFTYDDDWYPVTDGGGYSLEIVDPLGTADSWAVFSSWQESDLLHGSPGLPPSGEPPAGGLRVPGDANQDSIVDLSDAISLLRHLFHGVAGSLPCEGDGPSDGGNRTLLDVNGDEGVDVADAVYLLNYLFTNGPRPRKGIGCIRIEGCAEVCAGV